MRQDAACSTKCEGDNDVYALHSILNICMQVTNLLNTYLQRFTVHPIFSEQEVRHYFLPITNVVDTYVKEAPGKSCCKTQTS